MTEKFHEDLKKALPGFLTLAVITSGSLHIFTEYCGPAWQVYLFKPLTMVFIILMVLLAEPPARASYRLLILVGLLFSLLGDIFLMLPRDLFIPGLLSFLAAHLLYIAAFTAGVRLNLLSWHSLPFVIFALLVINMLWPGLGPMAGPVVVYIAVIMLMARQAWEKCRRTRQPAALLAFIGALLFVLSDTFIAVNKFVAPFPSSALVIMSTYFTAQWLIAASVRPDPPS